MSDCYDIPDSPCVVTVQSCPCGAKRLCRQGYAWRISRVGGQLILDTTEFVHGFPAPMTEQQHFLWLHRECLWNEPTPS